MTWTMKTAWGCAAMLCAVLFGGGCVRCEAEGAPPEALKILKVDPPNWWAKMPAPMLLVRGEGLRGTTFTLSDATLHVTKTVISENGHWAQLWLEASPAAAETVTLRARHGAESAAWTYRFAERHAAPEGFSSRDVIYLLMPDRFADGDTNNDGPHAMDAESSAAAKAEREKPRGWHGGDLRGVMEHLDYLQQLGVTAVWMTPVDQNLGAESYHGYHATDMYAVDPHFGSMEDLKALADALHKRGMKLVLDTVPNHVGPLHPWVTDEPAADWFHGTAQKHLAGETDFRALIDPHAPESARVGTLEGWFVDQLPDMDTESPAVETYLMQNAAWWIEEAGVDALRIDTFAYIDRPFWNAYLGELERMYPRLTEVGEVVDGDPVIVSSFADGVTRAGVDTKLYTPFDFPTFFALRDALRKDVSLTKVANTLADDELYPHPERLVVFFDNHDNARFLNGGVSVARMKLADAFVMTTRGTPELYYGDEIGMSGGEDPDNRKDFPGGFEGSAEDAFSQAGRSPEQRGIFAWVAGLAKMRREHDALSCGAEQVLAAKDDWLVYARDAKRGGDGCGVEGHSERVVVAIHRGKADASLDVALRNTWMEGCRIQRPEVSLGSSAMRTKDDVLHVDAAAEDAIVGVCE